MARKCIEDFLIEVSENTLLKEQDSVDIRRVRDALLTTPLKFYERFAGQRKNDPRLRRQLANAYFRIGQIAREIGPPAPAQAKIASGNRVEQIRRQSRRAERRRNRLAEAGNGRFPHGEAIWEPLAKANPTNTSCERRRRVLPRYGKTGLHGARIMPRRLKNSADAARSWSVSRSSMQMSRVIKRAWPIATPKSGSRRRSLGCRTKASPSFEKPEPSSKA